MGLLVNCLAVVFSTIIAICGVSYFVREKNALEKNKVPHIYNEMHGGHDASVHNPAFYNFVRRIFKEEK